MKTNYIWILIAAGFLLIPVADVRFFESAPLYPLDYICLAIIGFSIFSLRKGVVYDTTFLKIAGLFGAVLVAAFLSYLLNDPTSTGLGQLKSWVVLPALASLTAATALRQKYFVDNLLILWMSGLLVLLTISLSYLLLGNFTFDGRLQGPFTSPNFLALFVFPGIILSYYFWRKSVSEKSKVFFLTTGIAFLITLFFTHSFGGWLALTASVLWYTVRFKVQVINRKILLGLLLILILFLSTELIFNDKLENIFTERSSLASRTTIWTVALRAIEEQPVLGIGIGNFQKVYLSYQTEFPPFLEWAVPQPHNIFLALWLQFGLVGLVAILVLLWETLKKIKIRDEEKVLQSIFFGILIYGFFDTPLLGNALAFVWWMALAFLLLNDRADEN